MNPPGITDETPMSMVLGSWYQNNEHHNHKSRSDKN